MKLHSQTLLEKLLAFLNELLIQLQGFIEEPGCLLVVLFFLRQQPYSRAVSQP